MRHQHVKSFIFVDMSALFQQKFMFAGNETTKKEMGIYVIIITLHAKLRYEMKTATKKKNVVSQKQ